MKGQPIKLDQLIKLDHPVPVTVDYPLSDYPYCKMVVLVSAVSPYGCVITEEQMIAYIFPMYDSGSSIWRFNLS